MLDVAPESAPDLVMHIVEAVNPLVSFPRAGRVVPEFGVDHLREMIFENYRIVYTIDGDTVSVVSVIHAAMDVAARLRDLGVP